jgi:hypothetical protein
MKLRLLILLGGLAAVCGSAAAFVAIRATLLPPLADRLPSNFEAADTLFKQRVKDQFTVGSAESALIAELSQQGFQRADGNTYELERLGIVCKRRWLIFWTADDTGRLSTIDAAYGALCL